ncbi:ribose 5-phosphate isomerase B [Mycoplasmatota bacterium]|nr:ribose 5-phosphate isomerase B [Mycoplasmatota bacterium]
MKVALGSDHAGYDLKQSIKQILDEMKIEYTDFGTDEAISCDYSDYAIIVSEKVAKGEYDRGILVCGTGIGMSIASNKVKGIRAALIENIYSAKVTREHNNSNVLCLGGRVTGLEVAKEIVKTWLGTDFIGGKHERRVGKITTYENLNK